MIEIGAELLIGRKVHDVNGEKVGRIEEFQVERQDDACLVEAYLVGASGVINRLSAWTLVRPIQKVVPGRLLTVYRIPWDQLDLSDPERPVLTISKGELRHSK